MTNKNSNLSKQVYEFLKTIPKGKVSTYSQIAEYLGDKKLARAVGNILHKNPDPITYPCYKIVNQKGKLSEHFGDGGLETQKQRLQNDGIVVKNNKVDLSKYLFRN